MASSVTLSTGVRSNLLSLQNTAAMLATTQTRLATGNKVNSALDNPTNYFTASGLNSRASDLGQLLDSVSNAVQTIAAANNGITSITKLVETAQATARQALQTSVTVVTTPAAAAVAHADVTGSGFTAASVTASTFTINGTTITTTAAMTGTALAAAITAQETTTGVSATFNGTELVLHAVTTASGNPNGNITIAVGGGSLAGTGLTAAANLGTAPVVEVTGANPKRAELVDQYNELLTQIDQLAKDSGFNGVNLLNSDNLSVLFNEDGTSKLDIAGADGSSTGGLGLTVLASTAFDTNTSINGTLDDLKASIDTLRAQASKFGANLSVVQARQDFTKAIINTLQTGASNLTLADSNEEAANLLALQTRQSLSTNALSLASQSDQNVLRLLQ
jgi:flagellin